MTRFLRFVIFLIPAFLFSCSSQQDLNHRTLYVFGTLVEISASGASDSQFSAAMGEIELAFQTMHRDWHAWKPGALQDLNKAIANGQAARVDPDLAWLIERATELSEQSQGLFNPAIGGLIGVWGFHTDEFPLQGPPPSREQTRYWIEANPQMHDLSVTGAVVRSVNRAVQLDFGGMAKGLAVDRAMEILARHGIHNAIVNAGGDLRARGGRHGGVWRVGVKHPQGSGVIASIQTRGDEAIFTSGNYQRYRQHDEERWPHIIDPRDGQPVQHVASVTVIHPDASTADAAATALVVAGPNDWRDIARGMGVSSVMLVDEQGQVLVTPEMAARLKFEGDTRVEIVDI